ncbi:MAG: hypothetical protein ABI538_02440 [Pseudoxanthomonas sp.]
MIDIEAELNFWRKCYRKWPFHRRGLGFDVYIPTLKFGYDSYLLYHRQELDTLLPALKERYAYRLPAAQRLGWSCSQNIIRETWRRLQPPRVIDPPEIRATASHCVAAEQAYGVSPD